MDHSFLFIVGTLAVFYFALRSLSDTLPLVFESIVHRIVKLLSTNVVVSYVVGALLSLFTFSPLAVSLTALSYVNSGFIHLAQVGSVILGSFVGASFAIWFVTLFSTPVKFILLTLGLVSYLISSHVRLKFIARMFISLGLLLLGFEFLVISISNGSNAVIDFLQFLDTPKPFLLLFLGLLLTILFRSGPAVVSILAALFLADKIIFENVLYGIIGTFVGQVIPLLYESRKSHRETKGVSLFVFLSTLMVSVVIFILTWKFSFFEKQYFGSEGFYQTFIFYSLASFVVGTTGVLFSLGLEWFVNRVFPQRDFKEPRKIELIGKTSALASTLIIDHLEQEIHKLLALLQSIMELSLGLFMDPKSNPGGLEKLNKYVLITKRIQDEIEAYLDSANEMAMSTKQARSIGRFSFLATELENIGHCCNRLIEVRSRLDGTSMKSMSATINQSVQATSEFYEMVFSKILHNEEMTFEKIRNQYRELKLNTFEQQKMVLHSLLPEKKTESIIFIQDIYNFIRLIQNHTLNIVESCSSHNEV